MRASYRDIAVGLVTTASPSALLTVLAGTLHREWWPRFAACPSLAVADTHSQVRVLHERITIEMCIAAALVAAAAMIVTRFPLRFILLYGTPIWAAAWAMGMATVCGLEWLRPQGGLSYQGTVGFFVLFVDLFSFGIAALVCCIGPILLASASLRKRAARAHWSWYLGAVAFIVSGWGMAFNMEPITRRIISDGTYFSCSAALAAFLPARIGTRRM